MSQQQLASEIGVDVTLIGKYANGQRRLQPETTQAIATILDFNWQDFYQNT